MNKKILITTLLISCTSIKLLCMDPSLILLSAKAPGASSNQPNLSSEQIITQIEQIDKELKSLDTYKYEQGRTKEALRIKELKTKRSELNRELYKKTNSYKS